MLALFLLLFYSFRSCIKIFVRVGNTDLVSVFCMWLSIFPLPFVEETVFLSMHFCYFFVKNRVVIAVWVYFWILYSISLVSVSIFVRAPWYFCYYSCVCVYIVVMPCYRSLIWGQILQCLLLYCFCLGHGLAFQGLFCFGMHFKNISISSDRSSI